MAPSIDEFEDLTQFADESFDTDEVDLFEFADDEDSPLLRLKSIVLSLDWDITEETLAELNEELRNLRVLWEGDKVAQIYLQGMENVGRYLQSEGAYAHPNAIKLLLTLYYNYEKIISSTSISGEAISAMLKADIRKFKVLQYQISTHKDVQEDSVAVDMVPEEVTEPEELVEESTIEELDNPLKGMEATILGLEWEVTDEGLEKFHSEATELREYLREDREAQVLIQGLQALGSYIREQKTNAHPDAFTILHSFYDALKLLIENKNLSTEQRRQVLVEQITSLNALKEIIARTAAEKSAPPPSRMVQKEPEPVEEEAPEEEFLLSENELATEEEVEETLAPDAEEELDFNAFVDADAAEESSLSTLTDTDEDIFTAEPALAKEATEDEEEFEFDDDLFSSSTDDESFTPALADADEEGGFQGAFDSPDRALELDKKLDSFFDFDDDDNSKAANLVAPEPEPQQAVSTPAPTPPVAQAATAPAAEDLSTEDDLDSFFNFDDDEADTVKPKNLNIVDEEETGDEEETDSFFESEEDLDSFFNFDDAEDMSGKQEESVEGKEPAFDIKEEVESIASLSLEDDEAGLADSSAATTDDDDDSLDSFFSFDDDDSEESETTAQAERIEPEESEDFGDIASLSLEEENPQAEEVKAAAVTEEDDSLDSFFSFDDDDSEESEATAQAERIEPEESENFGDIASLSLEEENPQAEEVKAAAVTEEDDSFDSFFSFDDDDSEESEATAQADVETIEPEELEEFDDVVSLNIEEESTQTEEAETAAVAEEEEGLDSFFGFDDEESEEATAQADAESIEPEESEDFALASFSSEEELGLEDSTKEPETAAVTEEDEGLDSFFSFDDEDAESESIEPEESEDFALASLSSEEELGLEDSTEEPETATVAEEEEGFDSFFSFDDEESEEATAQADAESIEPEESEDFALASFSSEEELGLEDSTEEPETTVVAEEDEGLDSFFSFDDEESETSEATAQADAESESMEPEESEDFGNIASLSLEEESPQIEETAHAEEDDAATGIPLGIDSKGIADIQSKLDTLFHFDDDEGLAFTDDSQESTSSEDKGDVLAAEEENFFSSFADEETAAQDVQESSENEEQLDSFFALDAEEDQGSFAEAEEEQPRAEEAEEFFTQDIGIFGEETPAIHEAEEEDSDSFFALDTEENQSSFAEAVAEQAAEAETVENFFTEDFVPEAAPEEATSLVEETFRDLHQAAAAFATAPSAAALAEVQALAAAVRQEPNLPANQAIVAQLLDSSANLLAKAPEYMATDQAIIKELAAGFEQAAEPSALVDLIAQYTAWQQNFFAEIIKQQQAPAPRKNISEVQEVHEEFSRLRSFLMEEFQQLKKELHEGK